MNPTAPGPGRVGRSSTRVSTADRRQLAERPVSVRRILSLFRPYRARVALVVVLIVLSSLVGLAQPFLVRRAIDDAIPAQDVGLLAFLAAAMVAVAVGTAVLGVLQTWLSTAMGQQVMHRLRTDLFAHLQRQSVGFFTRTRGGEVQSRLINDVGGMQSVVTSTATSIASNVTVVVGTAARHGRPVLAPRADLAGGAPALDLADAPGGTDAPADHRRAAASAWPTCTSRSTRASRSAACCWPRPPGPLRR